MLIVIVKWDVIEDDGVVSGALICSFFGDCGAKKNFIRHWLIVAINISYVNCRVKHSKNSKFVL